MSGPTPVGPRSPCIIGVAQQTVRPGQGPAPEPLAQWERQCRRASDDSGGRGVLAAVESLDVLFCQSWPYDDAPGRLAERLGMAPPRRAYSGIGGTTPQLLVTGAASAILRGDLDVAMVVGGESLATVRALRKAGERPGWSHKDPERKPFPFEAPFHPAEVAHQVFQAWLTFALWDVARRAQQGVAPDDYRAGLGRLFAPFTEVAAANPHAWFPLRRDAGELVTPTASNRMVGYPYTKYLVAVMDVDMAAALVIASHERADALGVPPEHRVYLRGWGAATDPVYVAEHEPVWASPAMAEASAEALRCAGVGIDDVAHLDLYSCFPSSVLFACDALGIDSVIDDRSLTVTGGLPYHGGPGSCYMLHSMATMAGVLRADPGSYGLVSGVGMHMTKHCFGVWSTQPAPVRPPDHELVQARLDARPIKAIRETATGPATITTYSVVHDRHGEPEWGLAVCDLPDGDRCYARFDTPDLLGLSEASEWVGAAVELVPGDGNVNLVKA